MNIERAEKMTTTKRLAAKIDPNFVKKREGSNGQSLSYVAGHQMEQIANDVFEYGWSKETISMELLFKREYENSKKIKMFEVAYSCKVKVKTMIGDVEVVKEGTGFGNGQVKSITSPSSAYELALKEAETDAMKRALKSFGTAFGLELWDKDADIINSYKKAQKMDVDFSDACKEIEACKTPEEVGEVYRGYSGNYKNELAKVSIEKKNKLKEIK